MYLPRITTCDSCNRDYEMTDQGRMAHNYQFHTPTASFVGHPNGYHHTTYGCPILRPHDHLINEDGSLNPEAINTGK